MKTLLRNRSTQITGGHDDRQVLSRPPNRSQMRDGLHGRTVWQAVAYTLVLVVAVAACGSSGGHPTTKPGRTAGSVVFSELLGYPGAKSVAAPTVNGGATTQTFEVNGASPQKILNFYMRELGEPWTIREKPHALTGGSQSAWRGRWTNGGSTLLVSSEQTPTYKQGSVQYSLDLRKS